MIARARTRLNRLAAIAEPRLGGISASLRNWYAARALREQRLIAVLGVVAAVVLVVMVVVRPMQRARTQALSDIHTYATLEAQLRAAGPGGLSGQSHHARGAPATMIPEAAQSFGLTIQRIEPEGGGMRVTFADAPFEAVLGFVAQLDAADGIPVTELRIDRQAQPGRVDAQMLLGR